MEKQSAGRRAAFLGMLLALALLCSYVESLIPISFGIPGIKLGLANLVTVVTLYLIGAREACLVLAARIVLSGFLFGNLFAVVYSMAGGMFSFCIMQLLKWKKFHVITVSVAGGIAHNLGQLFVAALVVENANLFYYMSVLFFSGLVTGALIGILGQELILRLRQI